jgi:DNA-binding NtrC family response regulator
VDCSSLPENLFESELFGHERGAFTGANTARGGLVEAASGGTLFLDEVGDIPLTMQVKLLRLLETGTYRRVGSTEQRHADIRVVSATHRDLDQMVAQGRFREDLYYRLSTFPIHLPALRERRDDVPLLAAALLERVASQRKLSLSSESTKILKQQNYPGNVRELRNLLERATLLCDGTVLEATHITQALASGRGNSAPNSPPAVQLESRTPNASISWPARTNPASLQPFAAPDALSAAALAALSELAKSHTGSRAELAIKLGISERSLYRKLKALKPD